MPISFSAIVLAAGRSSRMGRDKALLEVEGAPLWRRQRELLVQAGAAELFLSARPDQSWVAEATGFAAVLHDALPDCGPIVGITAGLERMTQRHLAAIAIDLPQMTAEWFAGLSAECGPGRGVVGRRAGMFEPLAAIYPAELKWLAWETIAAGHYSLQRLLAKAVEGGLMSVREIGDAEAGWFANWNEEPR